MATQGKKPRKRSSKVIPQPAPMFKDGLGLEYVVFPLPKLTTFLTRNLKQRIHPKLIRPASTYYTEQVKVRFKWDIEFYYLLSAGLLSFDYSGASLHSHFPDDFLEKMHKSGTKIVIKRIESHYSEKSGNANFTIHYSLQDDLGDDKKPATVLKPSPEDSL